MNVHDSERIAGLLERDGYRAARRRARRPTSSSSTPAASARRPRRSSTRASARSARPRPRPARRPIDRRHRLRRAAGRRARSSSAARSIDVVVGTQSLKQLPRAGRRGARTARSRADRHQSARRRLVSARRRRATRIPSARGSPSSKAATSSARSASCRTRAGTSACGRSADILAEVARGGRDRASRSAAARADRQSLPGAGRSRRATSPSCSSACSAVPGIERVRFASPHPRHVSDRLIAAMRDLPRSASISTCRCSPDRTACSRRCAGATRARSTSTSSTGCARPSRASRSRPTSSSASRRDRRGLRATLDLVRRARYHSMYSFKYSPRPNTLASKRLPDDVPEAEKTRADRRAAGAAAGRFRSSWFAAAGRHGRRRPRRRHLAAPRLGTRRAGPSGNTVVNFPGPADWIGRIVPVRITEAAPNSLRGEAAGTGSLARRRAMLDRDVHQGPDDRPGHEHADRHPARRATSSGCCRSGSGPVEANAIALQIENVAPPRPMTHDLLRNLLDELGAHARRASSSPTSRTARSTPISSSSAAGRRCSSMRGRATRWRCRCGPRRRSSWTPSVLDQARVGRRLDRPGRPGSAPAVARKSGSGRSGLQDVVVFS